MKTLFTIICVSFALICNAWNVAAQTSKDIVYSKGNIKLLQDPDGWCLMSGKTVIGYGDGILDIDKIPPALAQMFDAFSTFKEHSFKKRKKKAISFYDAVLPVWMSKDSTYKNNVEKLWEKIALYYGNFDLEYDKLHINIDEFSTGRYIYDAITHAQPVIVNVKDAGISHTYIIRGCNENFYYIDFGFPGNVNGWFVSCPYSDSIVITIPRPKLDGYVNMQPFPKYIVIGGKDGENKYSMSYRSNEKSYSYWSDGVTLEPGDYTFCFEYEDGTRLAPYATSPIILGSDNREYEQQGLFVSTPASFKLMDSYAIDFCHYPGTMLIRLAKSDSKISGTVYDYDGNPVKGAIVTTANFVQTPAIISQRDGEVSFGYSIGDIFIEFVPTTNYITKLGLYIWVYRSVNSKIMSDLAIWIEDRNGVGMGGTSIDFSSPTFPPYYEPVFENPIAIVPGRKYYIHLQGSIMDDSYYVCGAFGENDYFYKIWGVDETFATTDENGNYTLCVPKFWSGTVNVFINNNKTNSLTFDRVINDLTRQDFR